MTIIVLDLAHSLSRYKLTFSLDKVDTMIVQAVSLLGDLDKELDNYTMRCREWYGWLSPELGKIVAGLMRRLLKLLEQKKYADGSVLSDLLPEDIVEDKWEKAAETSMGTEISE
ncbi:unnamed protein product [Ceutorhynchus assimilis]|uniref:NOSIC domain-containing protein n=1 Tax=Ceutorhynchus assimilis TaxID=467358 RepID=A0A9N9MQF8_9CUCU|nr:unnamed protein product [Ceutorhynchus assimilis]